ncbi:MAG TPA: hypothetical protein VMZ28_30920 [Kofleriaceae bacterium]|nr:hypothetical protein [Kofleriaceae bacterium]
MSAEALERALESQAVHGARLGTNLIETGAVKLDTLSEALARQHDLPAALERHFERSDPGVQQRVDAILAAQWRAVPLGKLPGAAERVAVAVMDPLPGRALTELGAALGAEVVQAIAPELRVRYQLERVYAVERPNRFKRMSGGQSQPGGGGSERRGFIRTLRDFDSVEPPSSLARISVRRIEVPVTGKHSALEAPGKVSTVEGAARSIKRATGRVRVGEILVTALESGFDGVLTAGMLMTMRANLLFGWRGFVRGHDPEVVEAVALPMDAPSIFSEPCRTSTSYFGPPRSESEVDHRLWSVLGAGRPGEIGVHPVTIFSRLACVIYVQTPGEMPADVAAGVAELGQALCASLERLVKAGRR